VTTCDAYQSVLPTIHNKWAEATSRLLRAAALVNSYTFRHQAVPTRAATTHLRLTDAPNAKTGASS
jgi:hypothetical protein